MSNELFQALAPSAAILISVATLVLSSNDKRRQADRDELRELRRKVERLERERDDFERKYMTVLEENYNLRSAQRGDRQ